MTRTVARSQHDRGTSGAPARPARPARPQLVVTDLDGTFLSPDGTVSAANSAAVTAAGAAGLPVVFATGRPVRWLEVVRQLEGGHRTAIASNGAVLYDLSTATSLDRICIDPEVALTAVAALRRALPGTTFAFDSGTRCGYEPDYRTTSPGDSVFFTGPAEEIAYAHDVVKMLVQNLTASPDQLLEQVNDVLGDTLTATHSAGRNHGLVEVSAPGVSKASMLRRLCSQLDVDLDAVAAFGDMPNDLEMLGLVGLPHVMANAHPELLGRGYTVVPANTESGVGRTMQRWLTVDGGR